MTIEDEQSQAREVVGVFNDAGALQEAIDDLRVGLEMISLWFKRLRCAA